MSDYSAKEECFNRISHGIGVLLAIAGLVYLLINFGAELSSGLRWALVVYGLGLTLMYLTSTIYHSVGKTWRPFAKKCDHLAIYVSIAGTYTPIALLGFDSFWANLLLILSWSLAAFGFWFKFSKIQKEWISLALYGVMGWLVLIAIQPLLQNFDVRSLSFLVIGGLLYTVGAIFYAIRKIPFNHAIWHVFVLGGSLFHFLCIRELLLNPVG